MMNTQYIETKGNDRMVIIPEKEYQALRLIEEKFDDARDIADIENHLKNMAGDDDETFPIDLVRRLSDGIDHPIKIYREFRGLKAKDLAAICGITPNFLSMIENGKKEGSLKLYIKLSRALNVGLDDLVEWSGDVID